MTSNRNPNTKKQNNKNSTAKTFAYFQKYPDGFRVGEVSCRLSNVPKNMAALKFNIDKLSPKIILFLAYVPYLIKGDVFGFFNNDNQKIYFTDQTAATGYKLETASDMSDAITRLKQGECNVSTDITNGPLNYDKVKTWHPEGGGRLLAELSRGLHQPVQSDTEECVKKMLEYVIQLLKEKNDQVLIKTLEAMGEIVGVMLLACLVTGIAFCILKRFCPTTDNNFAIRINAKDVETGENKPLLKDNLTQTSSNVFSHMNTLPNTSQEEISSLTPSVIR